MTLSEEVQEIIDDIGFAVEELGDHTTHTNVAGCAFLLGKISGRLEQIKCFIKMDENNGQEFEEK
jgi:hypothetical protein